MRRPPAIAPLLLLRLLLLASTASARRTVVCHSGVPWATAESYDLFDLPSGDSIAFLVTIRVSVVGLAELWMNGFCDVVLAPTAFASVAREYGVDVAVLGPRAVVREGAALLVRRPDLRSPPDLIGRTVSPIVIHSDID